MEQYASFTAAFKLKALDCALEHGNRAASRHFVVDEIRIRYWKKQRDKLKATNSTRWPFCGPKSGKFPDIEKTVLKYMKDMRKDGCAVSSDIIRTILEAWSTISNEVVVKSFKKTGISNALGGTEDDRLRDSEDTAGSYRESCGDDTDASDASESE
ncbi:hypothetical protein HPB51_000479 [Rhipicephalus microplus]|uniref:Pogo transposable element n=1 Tax=Rhipicephalus microplus TaxID=6941 RepID=A0A9J6D3M6_RHIMP|nr:hypothetical protein HPB51_000479 [Rhipicephalus microplus]